MSRAKSETNPTLPAELVALRERLTPSHDLARDYDALATRLAAENAVLREALEVIAESEFDFGEDHPAYGDEAQWIAKECLAGLTISRTTTDKEPPL